jgi:hypothetical protein
VTYGGSLFGGVARGCDIWGGHCCTVSSEDLKITLMSGFRRDVMKSAVFWGITRCRVVIVYRRFGTTYRSHLPGQESNLDP